MSKRAARMILRVGALIAFIALFVVIEFVAGPVLPGSIRPAGDGEDAQSGRPYLPTETDEGPSGQPAAPPPEESPSMAAPEDEPPVDGPEQEDGPETGAPVEEELTDAEKMAAYIGSMTLHDKVCQMLIVTPDSITGVSGTTVVGQVTRTALEKYPVGGLVHFTPNIIHGEQILLFNTTVQVYAKTPMFIAVDEEGGRVGRLKSAFGAHSVGAMLSYKDEGEETAFNNAATISETLKKHGFNTDFAPVADVLSNPDNTAIGDRAYSEDFDEAAILVEAAVRGFRESGIACSLKHFPGHGGTSEDSHNGAVRVNRTLDELRDGELIPFAAGISAGADMVMIGHLIVPGVDELPASLSATLVTDLLRGELGFDGIVITDSLSMAAITSNFTSEQVAVTAVNAGVDILLMPPDIDKTITALVAAVENGEIPESRLDESLERILSLKVSLGILALS